MRSKLTSGFPTTRDALFVYDALIIANVESDFFTRAQLQLAADFVSERGGGLLVLGGRSFAQRGLIGTPLEEVLPVELNDRRGGLARASLDPDRCPRHHLVDADAGRREPSGHADWRVDRGDARLWAAMPALAVERAARRSAAGRPGAGRDVNRRRRGGPARRRAALRPRPVDGVRG